MCSRRLHWDCHTASSSSAAAAAAAAIYQSN